MDKILYVGDNPVKTTNGGDWIKKKNILALKEIYKNNLHTFPIKCTNSYITFLNLLNNYMLGLSPNITNKILSYIEQNNIEAVFLMSSKLGKLAWRINSTFPEVKIYIFFHNIEKQYTEEECRINPSWKNRFIAKVTAYNEALACKYADKLILLNQRDNFLLKKIYNKEADLLLPTSFIDHYNSDLKKSTTKKDKRFTLLFVGFAFYANIEGVKWFIKNVLPELHNCKLQIIGSGMDKVFKSTDTIEVYGYVEDLSIFYYQADVVILPIFSGGGMKTKTAEALMYGCPIVGTKEAFEGYELDYDRIGGLTNTSKDMIQKINELENDKISLHSKSKYARFIFNQKYSINSTIDTLKQSL